MPSGIRATVAFPSTTICPIVEASTAAETRVDAVDSSACPPDCSASVTEFSLDAREVDVDATPVVTNGGTSRYRVNHADEHGCPCECLGRHGCVISRYVADESGLTIEFHAADYEELRDVVDDLRTEFSDVDVQRLVRTPAEQEGRDAVSVDRSKLTDRQLEVLETAYEMGYFKRPRRANATQVAAELGIDPSTLGEHLALAQSKLLADVL